ncbi:MAG: hypothetical protein MR690_03300 [Rikenellaceae bacterium]|nr:hypothetical protein [Rikenellaceae bacterium]MDY3894613.1 hypothetical protein [Candidatus Cryptobacteroides sp.]
MATYKSKQTLVSKAPYELYMAITDLRNIINMLPADKREGVTADFDSIHATVQGFSIGVRVTERSPYNLIRLKDDGAPFSFSIELHFDQAAYSSQTLFQIVVEAELNFMMKTLLGSKIQTALDKIAEGLADASNGKMPEGFDPKQFGF